MLKVCSWNPKGLRSLFKNSKSHLVAFMESEKPDIMFFPETKGNPKVKDEEVLEGYQFHHAYCTSPGKHGNSVAIRTTLQVHNVNTNIDDEGRIIEVICGLADVIVRVIGVYVPNASTGLKRLQHKIDWMKRFAEFVNEYRELVTIVVGDMNVAPTELDLANPKTNTKTPGYTVEERNGFAEFLKQCDLVDVWRLQHPNEKCYSFWTSRAPTARERNIGWRLDHCLIGSQHADKAESVIHTDVQGSDHCPIGISVKLK